MINDTELDAEDWQEIVSRITRTLSVEDRNSAGRSRRITAPQQLWGAIEAVFKLVAATRAPITYRRLHDIPDDWG